MSSIKIFQVPAILDGVTPRKDGGMGLRFVTNEVSSEEKITLMDFYTTFGWLQFSDSAIHEVPKEAPVREAGAKTPGQRIRAVLYRIWEYKYSDQPFEPWYLEQSERIINKLKEQLPPQ